MSRDMCTKDLNLLLSIRKSHEMVKKNNNNKKITETFNQQLLMLQMKEKIHFEDGLLF